MMTHSCGVTEPQPAPVELLDRVYGFGPCSREWSPSVPPAERTVVDLVFGNDDASPTAEQIRKVARAGGRNLHAFNIPIVRAELDVEKVQGLVGNWREGYAAYATTVVDPTNRTVELIVLLSRDLTDADIAAVEALGALVRSRWDFIDAYFIEIDDGAIPHVRALPFLCARD
jgi:hypothetical protein